MRIPFFRALCQFSNYGVQCSISRYKEGRVILERALVNETDGIDEHLVLD